jgi:hypothetical protein
MAMYDVDTPQAAGNVLKEIERRASSGEGAFPTVLKPETIDPILPWHGVTP